jgi:hypothetical protein
MLTAIKIIQIIIIVSNGVVAVINAVEKVKKTIKK